MFHQLHCANKGGSHTETTYRDVLLPVSLCGYGLAAKVLTSVKIYDIWNNKFFVCGCRCRKPNIFLNWFINSIILIDICRTGTFICVWLCVALQHVTSHVCVHMPTSKHPTNDIRCACSSSFCFPACPVHFCLHVSERVHCVCVCVYVCVCVCYIVCRVEVWAWAFVMSSLGSFWFICSSPLFHAVLPLQLQWPGDSSPASLPLSLSLSSVGSLMPSLLIFTPSLSFALS